MESVIGWWIVAWAALSVPLTFTRQSTKNRWSGEYLPPLMVLLRFLVWVPIALGGAHILGWWS